MEFKTKRKKVAIDFSLFAPIGVGMVRTVENYRSLGPVAGIINTVNFVVGRI